MPLGRWPDVTIADAPQPDIEATVAAATKEVYTFSCAPLSFVQ
jgi:hypothetical protein